MDECNSLDFNLGNPKGCRFFQEASKGPAKKIGCLRHSTEIHAYLVGVKSTTILSANDYYEQRLVSSWESVITENTIEGNVLTVVVYGCGLRCHSHVQRISAPHRRIPSFQHTHNFSPVGRTAPWASHGAGNAQAS